MRVYIFLNNMPWGHIMGRGGVARRLCVNLDWVYICNYPQGTWYMPRSQRDKTPF